MPHATARIATVEGARLIKRLCTHWAHKLEVAHEPGHGRVVFGPGATLTLDATEAELHAVLDTPDADADARLREVVAEHLQRMAREGELVIDWR